MMVVKGEKDGERRVKFQGGRGEEEKTKIPGLEKDCMWVKLGSKTSLTIS